MTTLTDDELARIKREVMSNVLDLGASPYIDQLSVFQLIRDHVVSSTVAPTTSSTAVTSTGPTVLTLDSVTGLVSGSRVVLDCDDQRETVTVRAVMGSTISVVCRKLHGGTYPVEVESPLTTVRGLLSDLISMELLERDAPASAGLKKADEVEWFGGGGDDSPMKALARRRAALRMELANVLGIGWVLREALARGRGGNFEAY
jgi:hypothetical protein